MTQEMLVKCIGFASQVGDMDAVTELTNELNTMINPVVEKKTRAAGNTSGYVQVDPETGKEVARFATTAEANEAMGKKKTASCIASACRNYSKGLSQMAYGFKWFYGSDFDAQ